MTDDVTARLDTIERKLDMIIDHFNIEERPVQTPTDISLWAKHAVNRIRARGEKKNAG